MSEAKTTQPAGIQVTDCLPEKGWQRILRLCKNFMPCASYLFTFRNYYYIEVQQALQKVESEYKTLKGITVPNTPSPEARLVIESAIQKLICEARREKNYSKIWPVVHQIELLLIKLYGENMLKAQLSLVRNNLYVLDEKDQELWNGKLNEYEAVNAALVEKIVEKVTKNNDETVTKKVTYKAKEETDDNESAGKTAATGESADSQKKKTADIESLRALLYTITAEINEARRIEYMTNDLKRVLLGRIMRWTLVFGFCAWIFAYSLIKDPLVNYAVLLGILGGFFSRIRSTDSMNFKPPAFALFAQYTYVQPLIGGIGAMVMYFILLSPLGTEVINDSLYLNERETINYIVERDSMDRADTSWAKKYLPPFRVHTFISIDVPAASAKKASATVEKSSGKPNPKVQHEKTAKSDASPKQQPDTTKVDSIKTASHQLIAKYPKPLLLLILAFLAGFSEKFFMGTVNKIVGSKFITIEQEEKKTEKKKEGAADSVTEKTTEKKTT